MMLRISQTTLHHVWGFGGGDYEEWRLLGCYAVWLLQEPTFRRNLAPQSSGWPCSSQRASVASCGYVPGSPILVTLMKETLSSSETRFLQEPHGVTSQKTAFYVMTCVNDGYQPLIKNDVEGDGCSWDTVTAFHRRVWGRLRKWHFACLAFWSRLEHGTSWIHFEIVIGTPKMPVFCYPRRNNLWFIKISLAVIIWNGSLVSPCTLNRLASGSIGALLHK
jgi:hypothetical protein